MLVIVTATGAESARWTGRRHDDVGRGAKRGDSDATLFEAIFEALHDGEQVAVGFPAPLCAAMDATWVDVDVAIAALALQQAGSPALRHTRALLTELGRWRPWTGVSTSLPRWRATTSVLVFEADVPADADLDELDRAVEGLFALVHARADHGAEVVSGPLINLAAAAARDAGLTTEAAELGEPVVLVPSAATEPRPEQRDLPDALCTAGPEC